MKARAHKQTVEAAQGARMAELEADNGKLLVDLEQTRLALTEADVARSSLSVSQDKLERECTELCTTVGTLK
jgi:hypothetical protein